MTDRFRSAELAKIHIARQQMALDEATYRALVARISSGRTESSKDLTEAERHALIDYFKRLGFAEKKTSLRAVDPRPQAAKLKALWAALWELGETRSPDDAALVAFVARHTGIVALKWNSSADLHRAIDCLKGWCARVGYQPRACADAEAASFGRYEPGLIEAQWQVLIKAGVFRHGSHARLDTWIAHQGWHVTLPQYLTPEQGREAVKRLGRWLRRAQGHDGGGDG